MPWEAWLTVVVVVVLIVALARNWASPDALVLGALVVVLLAGELTRSERLPTVKAAVSGFGNPAPLTVGVLFVVVAGLVHTGALQRISRTLLGTPKREVVAQLRLIAPVWSLSAFLNNTPIVAMFLPLVSDLARRARLSASKLFIPLSYASILGGICTLIGTSTNLVVNGLLVSQRVLPRGLGMFDITWLGVPCALVGMAFLLLVSRWLLPNRQPVVSSTTDVREFTAEMIVDPSGPLVGKTLEQAGLRALPGLFVTAIERERHVMPAIGSQMVLAPGDHLVFAGALETMIDLRKLRGLRSPDPVSTNHRERPTLVAAVVSDACPLVGTTIRAGRFRTHYDAAVVAIARGGRRLSGKLGDVVLLAGDTLLLEADPSFLARNRDCREFFLVSQVESDARPRYERAWVALVIVVAMVLSASIGWVGMLTAASVAAVLMIFTGCCTVHQARQSIDWTVLLVIGGALGLGQAISTSGAAAAIAGAIVGVAGNHPWLVLAAIYLTTTLFTEVITNNAAVALVFPIAIATSNSLGVSPMPFVMCIMIAGSASFATPIGYQTNLMVYGPGGYTFGDFLRIGLPLNFVVMVVAVTLAPLIWPF